VGLSPDEPRVHQLHFLCGGGEGGKWGGQQHRMWF
jgi:hypothetical protein